MIEDLKKEILGKFFKQGLLLSRKIAGADGGKSSYLEMFPNHHIVFNAVIICEPYGLIWEGDLDLDFDCTKLKRISENLKTDLYIVRDCDSGSENTPFEVLRSKSLWSTK